METLKFCQSCSMPLDNKAFLGTQKDGSPSNEYCKYCYINGAFVNPKMTMAEMKTLVREKLVGMKTPDNIIQMAEQTIPHLRRWQK